MFRIWGADWGEKAEQADLPDYGQRRISGLENLEEGLVLSLSRTAVRYLQCVDGGS